MQICQCVNLTYTVTYCFTLSHMQFFAAALRCDRFLKKIYLTSIEVTL